MSNAVARPAPSAVYYAILWPGRDASDPLGLARRRPGRAGVEEEVLGRDHHWHQHAVVTLAELNLYDYEITPIPEEEARALQLRWSQRAPEPDERPTAPDIEEYERGRS